MASTYITLPAQTVTLGTVDVVVTAQNDSIAIANGANTLAVNPDGSINVAGMSTVTGSVSIDGGTVTLDGGTVTTTGQNEFEYNQVSVPPTGSATVVSHFFATNYKLRRVSATGATVGVYTVRFNGSPVDKLRSNYTDFNCRFDYETGIAVPAGTTVSVLVENGSTTDTALFSAQLLFSAV